MKGLVLSCIDNGKGGPSRSLSVSEEKGSFHRIRDLPY